MSEKIKCSIKNCRVSITKTGYIRDRSLFNLKPLILCVTCYNRKDPESDYIPRQHLNIPKELWKPDWKQLIIDSV